MGGCWAPDCNHNDQRESCSFFYFPTNQKELKRWKKLLRRVDEPGVYARVCSCHFRDGKKENGPELFEHNAKKRFSFSSPEKHTRKRKIKAPVLTETRQLELDLTMDVENIPPDYSQPSTSRQEPMSSTSTAEPMSCPSISTTEPMSCPLTVTVEPMSRPSTATAVLESEIYFLKKELNEIKASRQVGLSYKDIKDDDRLITMFTGLPNAEIFEAVCNLFEDANIRYIHRWNVVKMSRTDQILLCLMKLRQNYTHLDLSHRFKISEATVSNVFLTWVHVLHAVLFKQLMGSIPSRNKNKTCLPNCFSSFTNCRIILDCTEIPTVTSRTSMATQRDTYSTYKHGNTWKALIGVAPNGVITYVSDLYAGSMSDKKIVSDCGILDQFEAGDLILADKGFLIKDILPAGVHLNIPPFLVTAQFTPEQVYQTEKIAKARIHVERAIQRMKCYKILHLLPYNLLQFGDVITQVIGALVNFQNPLIKEVQNRYSDSSDSE